MIKSVSVTDVTAFKTCRTRWDYSSYLRQYVRPSVPASYFRRGLSYHEVLPWIFQEPDHTNEQLRNKIETAMIKHNMLNIGDAVPTAVDVIKEFKKYAKKHYLLSKITPDNIVSVEEKRRETLLLEDDLAVDFVYLCDMIVRIDGKLYIFDFKTTSKMDTQKDSMIRQQFNDQATGYSAATFIREHEVPTFVWIFINTGKLEQPTMLKKGRFSRAKSQYLSMPAYIQAIKDSGQDYEFYAQFIIEHTIRMYQRMFRVIPIKRPLAQLENYWIELHHIAQEMIDPDVLIYNAPYTVCGNCPYESACYHKRVGGDDKKVVKLIQQAHNGSDE